MKMPVGKYLGVQVAAHVDFVVSHKHPETYGDITYRNKRCHFYFCESKYNCAGNGGISNNLQGGYDPDPKPHASPISDPSDHRREGPPKVPNSNAIPHRRHRIEGQPNQFRNTIVGCGQS